MSARPKSDHWRRDLEALYGDRYPLDADNRDLWIYLKLRTRVGVTPPLTLEDLMRALRWPRRRLLDARESLQMFRMLSWERVKGDRHRPNVYTVHPSERWGFVCQS